MKPDSEFCLNPKVAIFIAVLPLVFLSGCGGSSTSSAPPATYSIGGTVSGLAGSGLVLLDNGGNPLSVPAGTNFTFTSLLPSGSSYAVTVSTQPSNPAQSCVVSQGTGVANGNVTSVQLACTTITYTIGGEVTGLTGKGLVLQDNGAGNLTVASDGPFTFASPLTPGSAYSVSVLTQPSSPAQTCSVASGTGTATANVTTVQISCTTLHNAWIWTGGSTLINQAPSYGTRGSPASSNSPGARQNAVTWTDAEGNFWLFGGFVLGSQGFDYRNDLWKFSQGQWTWISGSASTNQPGTYGTLGTAAPGNIPGARGLATSWLSADGSLWLFGGVGLDSTAAGGDLNDLWKFTPGENPTWSWIAGSNLAGQLGSFGAKGIAAAGNVPGARDSAAGWVDPSGNFWLFGGFDLPANQQPNALNDLWSFSAGQWAWVAGSSSPNQSGVYGERGVSAAGNIPGARFAPTAAVDATGKLLLFGGNGFDSSAGGTGELNDLWSFANHQWTWLSGSNLAGDPGSYGAVGVTSSANVPSSRDSACTPAASSPSNSFWLFGGVGMDASNKAILHNDLWEWTAGEWTWISGSSQPSQPGIYGTLAAATPGATPGSRQSAACWIDPAGNLWLYGGYGLDANGDSGDLNDFWVYQP